MFSDRTVFPHQITVMDLLLIAFAAKALIDLWRESSLLAGFRAYFEAWGGKVAELSGCGFCLSYHACFWMTVLGRLLAAVLPSWLGLGIFTIMLVLAATGVTHMLIDLNELILGRDDDDDDTDATILPIKHNEEEDGG